MKVFIILGLLLSFSLKASALIAGPSSIEGTIKSFDERTVRIEGPEATYDIPRELLSKRQLKSGNKVEIILSSDQVSKVHVIKKKK